VSQFLESLSEHQNDPVTVVGKSRAELFWEDESMRYKIILSRENQEWRIHDVQMRALDEAESTP
jgi:hypothetical protein